MTRTHHRVRTGALLTAAGILGVVLVAGCGGDTTEADPTPSFSPTTSAPTAASTPPSEATSSTATQESPEDFVRRFFEVGTQMQNTGMSSAWLGMTHGCSACRKTAKTVGSYFRAGGYVHVPAPEVGSITQLSSGGLFTELKVDVVEGRTRFRTTEASPEQSFPGGPATYRIVVEQSGSTWLVKSFDEFAS